MGFARDVQTFKNMRGNGDFFVDREIFFVLPKEVLRFMRVTVSACCFLFQKEC